MLKRLIIQADNFFSMIFLGASESNVKKEISPIHEKYF